MSVDVMKIKLRCHEFNEATRSLYDIEGHIALYVKNVDSIESMSFRQVVKSLPPVIIGHIIHQHESWIDAGALMAEHLAKKFVPRAMSRIEDIDESPTKLKYNFGTHIMGYSLQSLESHEDHGVLRGTSIAEWNEYPYRVKYEFRYNVLSTAQKNYKYLGYQNYIGYKLRDERFKEYIRAIVKSQPTQVFDCIYDINKAMSAVMFLVE